MMAVASTEKFTALHPRERQGVDGKVIVGLVLVWLITSFSIFTFGPFTRVASWEGDPVFYDMETRYSIEQAHTSLAVYGESGRAVYARHLLFDTAAVLLQTIAVAAFLLYAIRRNFGARSRWQLLAVPIVFLGAIDLAENIAIAGMLGSYPDVSTWMIGTVRTITSVKFFSIAFLPLSILAAVVLLFRSKFFG